MHILHYTSPPSSIHTPNALAAAMQHISFHTSALPLYWKVHQVTISPISTTFSLHLLPSAASLGSVTSPLTGEYKYQLLSAAAAALTRASFRLAPAPSPNLSPPEYTPTTKTGVRDSLPVSEMRRATGGSQPSRAQSRERSRVGCVKWKSVCSARWRERMCAVWKLRTAGRPAER